VLVVALVLDRDGRLAQGLRAASRRRPGRAARWPG
jgi:hypothetical protein